MADSFLKSGWPPDPPAVPPLMFAPPPPPFHAFVVEDEKPNAALKVDKDGRSLNLNMCTGLLSLEKNSKKILTTAIEVQVPGFVVAHDEPCVLEIVLERRDGMEQWTPRKLAHDFAVPQCRPGDKVRIKFRQMQPKAQSAGADNPFDNGGARGAIDFRLVIRVQGRPNLETRFQFQVKSWQQKKRSPPAERKIPSPSSKKARTSRVAGAEFFVIFNLLPEPRRFPVPASNPAGTWRSEKR